jgi:hypothetical protein
MHGLFGEGLHEPHERLYKEYPSSLGYSARDAYVLTPDDVLFSAVLVLALYQAGLAGSANLQNVYFLVPGFMEKRTTHMMRAAAERIFARLKTGGSVKAIKHVGALFHRVMMGCQVFTLPEEPQHWVAFGFSKSDHIPEWMRAKLLVFGETSSEAHPGV